MKISGKRLLALVVSLMLVVALLAGCGSTPPKTEPAATAASTAVAEASTAAGPAAPDNTVYKFKLSHFNGTNSFLHTYGHVRLVENLKKASNGRIDVEIYPAQTLGKAADQYDMVLNGIADITWGPVSWFPSRFPLAEVTALPMLGFEDATHSTKVLMDLWNNTDYFKTTFTDAHMLLMHDEQPQGLVTKEPVTKMEDLKGMKIRSPGGPLLKFYEALGAGVISMPMGDVYQAVEKGVVSGWASTSESFDMLNAQDITKYYLDVPVSAGAFFMVMNQQKWDSLPEDIQKIFNEECGLKGALLFADAFDQTKAGTIDKLTKGGMTLNTLSAEEMAKWTEVGKQIEKTWIDGLAAKGFPAQKLVDDVKVLIEKYKTK